jgi:hypothetical protein
MINSFACESRVILTGEGCEHSIRARLWDDALALARRYGFRPDRRLISEHVGEEPEGVDVTPEEVWGLRRAFDSALDVLPDDENWYDFYDLDRPYASFAGEGKPILEDLLDFCRRTRGFTITEPKPVRVVGSRGGDP